jgi:hypothetical protein
MRLKEHPWDRWFIKPRITLKRGRDFDCQPHSMGVQIRQAAKKRGLHFSVRIDEGNITVINTAKVKK